MKPQKALRQRIKAFKQRQVDDLLNQYRNKGQKNGDKAEAATAAGKAGQEAGVEDAFASAKREQEESKAMEAMKDIEVIESDTASQQGK